ncbi:MAG TPA: hypothetical protein VEC16_02280 [Alphaproteobacteria bacterium]|nr:hypothetical protein [Alphaproteobacteria bacterium]
MNNQTSQLEMKLKKKQIAIDGNVFEPIENKMKMNERFTPLIAELSSMRYFANGKKFRNRFVNENISLFPQNPEELTEYTLIVASFYLTDCQNGVFTPIFAQAEIVQDFVLKMVDKGYASFSSHIDIPMILPNKDKTIELKILNSQEKNINHYDKKNITVEYMTQLNYVSQYYNCSVIFNAKVPSIPYGLNTDFYFKKGIDRNILDPSDRESKDDYMRRNFNMNVYSNTDFYKFASFDLVERVTLSHYCTKDELNKYPRDNHIHLLDNNNNIVKSKTIPWSKRPEFEYLNKK